MAKRTQDKQDAQPQTQEQDAPEAPTAPTADVSNLTALGMQHFEETGELPTAQALKEKMEAAHAAELGPDERELPAGFIVQPPGGPEWVLTEPAIVRARGIGDEQAFVSVLIRDRRNFELCRDSLSREYDPMSGAAVIEPKRKPKQ